MTEYPIIPGYHVERELGQGGMARVYLAQEEKLDRLVALKVLLPTLTEMPHTTERFIKEAKTAAKLVHPNILVIYDVGQHGNVYYMAVEYLEGGSLKERIGARRGGTGLPPAEALGIIRTIAVALDYAHGRGIVHRDVKPDNIMFRKSGEPVLVDFGIAKAVDSATKLTKTGMALGTPHYMSVEQLKGEEPDGRADLYSLGIVLFEMLTGKVPYNATDTIAVAVMHIQQPIPRLPEGLASFQPLVDRLLAKDRALRFQNGADLAAEIDRLSAPAFAQPGAGEAEGLGEDEAAFQFACKLGTAEAFRIFLEGYPQGARAGEARARLQRLKMFADSKAKKDKVVFEMAARIHSGESYGAYIEQFPAGQFVAEARARIAELQDNETLRPSGADSAADSIGKCAKAGDEQGAPVRWRRPRIVLLDSVATQGAANVLVWEDDAWVKEHLPLASRNHQGFWEIVEYNSTNLIYVPAGKFIMGADEDGEADERPAREVWLDGYWIGKFPVTFEQFDRFCAETGIYRRGGWIRKSKPDDHGWGRGEMPVINVNVNEAQTYCQWLSHYSGKAFALPTEAQWEKAARGTDGRIFPWGDEEPTCEMARFTDCLEGTVPVVELAKGASPYGAMHMAGNVWEWCADSYEQNYYKRGENRNPLNEGGNAPKVMRGGAFNNAANTLRCSKRSYADPSQSYFAEGFRIVMRLSNRGANE